MNITKNNKIQPDLSPQSKSFIIISKNYQIENLYNILKKSPSLVNTKDQKNETFLSYAIKRKNIEIAELILTSPILDYSYQDSNGNSYLHLAVINQLESIIRTLIQKGINVNLQNNEGNTALHFAYSTGDIKFITIIIESKADFTIKNKNGLIAEEIPPGTFPEILDINNNNNRNNINITQNKNNTVTINLNNDNDNNNDNNNENDKDNNDIIINDRGQKNKSIRMNWDYNGVNINNNNANINTIESSIPLNNNSITNNQFENTSKTKLKYSLVNFSYSDDGEGEKEIEDEIEENGLIPQTNDSKEKEEKETNVSDNKKNKIKSSDIFDLTSSLSYQEKVANASSINAHVVGEPTILSKKDSNEYGLNEDIVNINKLKTIEEKPLSSSIENNELNNMNNKGLEISQMTFQTACQNGRNINISQVNLDNGNGKSVNFQNKDMDIDRGNGRDVAFNYSTSINGEERIPGKIDDINESQQKRESEGICNYDNNNNFMQSNIYRPQPEFNQDFAFSPVNSLKEPLNKKENGSEVVINNSNNINNSININNNSNNLSNINNNSNNLSNININNEINKENQGTPSKTTNNIDSYSTTLQRCNALKETSINNSNHNIDDIKTNNLINRIAKSAPTKSNNLHSINTNLSQASQNNLNRKTNSNFDFNCPVSLSEEVLNSSTTKNSKDPLYKFLAEIRMEKYYDIMNSNGFDDINLLINQTKSSGIGIKDKQLKEVGINLPGDRAKILIKLQEKAGNFLFPVPKEVYHVSLDNNIKNDSNIKKLNEWLKALKIENYLENFVNNGYHSIELMLLQMESKNKLTDEILKDEIGITKMGHRSRIINKLIEEGKSLNNKLKTSMLIVGNVLTEKICECSIY